MPVSSPRLGTFFAVALTLLSWLCPAPLAAQTIRMTRFNRTSEAICFDDEGDKLEGATQQSCADSRGTWCPSEHFCAWGTSSAKRVGLLVDEVLVSTADLRGSSRWHIHFPIERLAGGRRLKIEDVGESQLVLDDTSRDPAWILSIEGGLVARLEMTKDGARTTTGPAIAATLGTYPTSVPWLSLRLRYAVALIDVDWIHRASIVGDAILYENDAASLRLVLSGLVGIGMLARTAPTGKILLAGAVPGIALELRLRINGHVWIAPRAGAEGFLSALEPATFFDGSISLHADW